MNDHGQRTIHAQCSDLVRQVGHVQYVGVQ